jgi:hypothetical protein
MNMANTNDLTELQNENAELRSQLLQKEASIKKLTADHQKQIDEIQINSQLNSLYQTYSTVFDGLPVDVKYAGVNSVVQQELQQRNAEIVLDEDKKLKLQRKDGTNIFGEDNRPWDFKTLVDHSLKQNKILKVTDATATGPKTTPAPATVIYNENEGNNNNTASPYPKSRVLKDLATRSLSDLQQSS